MLLNSHLGGHPHAQRPRRSDRQIEDEAARERSAIIDKQLIDRPVSRARSNRAGGCDGSQPICNGTNRCPSARREPSSEPYILAIPSSPEVGPPATTNKSSRPLTYDALRSCRPS